jgi:hypothetical protein
VRFHSGVQWIFLRFSHLALNELAWRVVPLRGQMPQQAAQGQLHLSRLACEAE